ncbi:VRR-NUC domain-containing protein [Falsiroseomonas tokyonensis]|uniref:VRR-NUC domain-containing protein n=1 Tax=Falsiroseomonas tokyonensis TaxID=430521 RepID=A0ABV7C1K3_9PROT|nr:VRR-NUC domain-containing protein [Falsiroseomonas tokyonensis]MBU8540832.1 hypothetical protein [Falsiroseomonas tokyonensis]
MSETPTLQDIRLALGREQDLRLFRNNVGSGWQGKKLREGPGWITLGDPRRVSFGLFPGSSDLIGWKSIIITPEMVGQRFAQIASLEVKVPGGTHPVTPEQRQWLAVVEAAGGIGGVARSPEQARMVLGLPQRVLV